MYRYTQRVGTVRSLVVGGYYKFLRCPPEELTYMTLGETSVTPWDSTIDYNYHGHSVSGEYPTDQIHLHKEPVTDMKLEEDEVPVRITVRVSSDAHTHTTPHSFKIFIHL